MTIICPECDTRQYIPDQGVADVKCRKCAHVFALVETHKENAKPSKMIFGWLLVMDEKASPQTFEITQARSVVGRADTNKPCDIMVETTDMYMSRRHFQIEVLRGSGPRGVADKVSEQTQYQYLIKDVGSLGGTHIETKVLSQYEKAVRKLAEGEEVYISDGAIILAGETKLVFKSLESATSEQDAARAAGKQQYVKTVMSWQKR